MWGFIREVFLRFVIERIIFVKFNGVFFYFRLKFSFDIIMFLYVNCNYRFCIVVIYFFIDNSSKFYRNIGLGEIFLAFFFYLDNYKFFFLVLFKESKMK